MREWSEAVFVSDAREDVAAPRRIAEARRSQCTGLRFEQPELRGAAA